MVWRQGVSAPFGNWRYVYNPRGQRTNVTDITGRSAEYGYDSASRLASETIAGDPRGASFNGALSYVLDGAGNRISRASTLPAIAAATYSYDPNDQLGSDTYNVNGNTTSADGHTYAYDFENRLVSKDGGAVTIVYDCDGHRVAKTVGGVTKRYLVDDLNPTGYLQVLEEVVSAAVQTRYTYGTTIVSQTHNISTSPATSYYGYDAHGNVTFLTDPAGVVTDSYDYDAWGILLAATGSTPNTRLYSGEELEPDLGLVNLRARQYRPSTGRFLTLDPASGRLLDPLSSNRFLYASSDPANRRDPSGLFDAGEYGVMLTTINRLLIGTSAPIAGTGVAAATVGATAASAGVALGVAGYLGYKTACNLYFAASAFEVLEAAQTNRPPVPPPAPFEGCKPTMPHNCSEERQRDLEDQKDAVCKGNRCRGTDSCDVLAQKLNRNQLCESIRLIIMRECFSGGDDGHGTAADQARNSAMTCMAMIADRC